ncbi:MAG TPA: radical SAM family heme chaperone HemW [Chitinophagaceae bacterium]
MAGIYVHIPFCRRACHYCNFHFSTSAKQMDAMIQAICREAELRHEYINESTGTVYFGGGTPSLLPISDLRFTIGRLKNLFEIDNDAEITLEANPDDITVEKLDAWKAIEINRLSIGVQSFFHEDLEWMNRSHSSEQALRSIQLAQQAGFDNITIDLIYGIPALTNNKWKQNVETALSLNVPHLSCYALTIEPNTALEKMIAIGKLKNVDPDKQSCQFELLMQWMEDAGYEHYEISNFARRGYRSKHNSSYWQGKHYIGLGPSAHSFNGYSRQWNIANNALYIKSFEQDIIPCETELLTKEQQLNEYIMTRLRTIEGLSLITVSTKWNNDALEKILQQSKKFVQREMMFEKDDHLILTKKGKLFADGIAADLFF